MNGGQSLHDLQCAVLDAVAPANWRDMGITAATLELNARGLPRLTLETYVPLIRGSKDCRIRRHAFELRPLDAPASLDLEQMAEAACQRIASEVQDLARHASVQTALAFKAARARADKRHQAGHIVPAALLGAIAIALVLGALGPALDAQPDRRAEWLQAEQELQQQGALARWEAEARRKCTALGGENSAYVRVDGGGVVCKTKRGHLLAQKGRP